VKAKARRDRGRLSLDAAPIGYRMCEREHRRREPRRYCVCLDAMVRARCSGTSEDQMMVVIAGDVLLEEDERDAYLEAHSDLVTRARPMAASTWRSPPIASIRDA
jgi:hypothetical protein